MKFRCYSPKADSWHLYGGRGIKICERWRTSFANFLADMGPRPLGTSIERIDRNKDYEPENCRWATLIEQARNKRNNRILEWRGGKYFTWELAERFGVTLRFVQNRLCQGWPVEDIFTRPVGSYPNRAGEANNRAKLTAEQVSAIRAEYSSGTISQRELGNKYSVRPGTIHNITSGKGWKT